jgi:hypothetical protein
VDNVEILLLSCFIVASILLVLVTFLNILILGNKTGKRMIFTLLSIDLVVVWLYSSYLYSFIDKENVYGTFSAPIFLTTIMLAASLNLSTYTIVPRFSYFPQFKKITNYLGLVIVGLVVSQYFSPLNIKLIWTENAGYVFAIKTNYIFLSLLVVWSTLTLVLLHRSTFSSQPRKFFWKNRKVKYFYNLGVTLLIGGFLMIVTEMIYVNLDYDHNLHVIFFICGRILPLVGLNLILLAGKIDKKCISSISRVIYHLSENKLISISLNLLDHDGPKVIFHEGFSFIKDKTEIEDSIFKLALVSMTALGIGQEYVEGSAIIPIPFNQNYTGIILTKWIEDEQQIETRFGGRSFIALLIVLPKNIEWLLYKRSIWEKGFEQMTNKVKSRVDLDNKQNLMNFVIEQLNDIAFLS